ncbi:H dehydrogenase [Seminavis robusta]|uniref:H dehydrogenase n=1 Tax=Seminavis robusta TaxID=568900 RepID=A0A9N8EF67_9STRA|nr:H dehydrogenase [Seminavis robusta]|eukprot:Sro849_g210500.1 H dehydrogenase (205) ;mRNA; r:7554-8250
MAKIIIVYYSMYGHVKTMAQKVKEGVDSVGCAEAVLYQVPETLPEEVLKKMGAPPKDADVPVIKASDLADADGIIFGIPTRFGMAAAQMKAFMDSTGGLWQGGKLAGKPAGIFFSTGTQGGGQETTAMTWLTQLVHHGMVYVPTGYHTPKMFQVDTPEGGSPWGAGTFAGADGSRMPSEFELERAKLQGEGFAKVALALKSADA